MIPDSIVDEVRARADLVEVIGELVPLKKSGKEWKGQCPFHDDRSPSFYVVPDKGFYKCFGCGESGDVFTFLMKRSGMEFLDAVRSLGSRYGIEIRELSGKQEEEDPFRPHYEANAFAQDWFRRQLLDSEAGKRGLAYLKGRGIGAETAERFGLGLAPDGWRGLRDAAAQHEIPEHFLLEVGLLTTSEKRSDPYDRFRNRITFPIESVTGKVLAFGGRTLETDRSDTPKYLNSPESPIYHKGEVLYALGWSRNAIRREGAALVVEGYMDAVALAAHGVEHVVATLGTALTPEHAVLLKRYTTRALLFFDSDEAGLRATFRAADILLAHGVHPSVVTLPPGEDPDTAVRKEGATGLKRYLDGAVDVLDRKLQLLDEKGFFGSIDKVRLAVDKLLPTLRSVRDPTLRDIYIARTSERTGVRRETLEEEVAKGIGEVQGGLVRSGSSGTAGLQRGGSRPEGRTSSSPSRKVPARKIHLGVERQLLLLLLRSRGLLDRAIEQVGPGEFHDPAYRAIFEALIDDPGLATPPEGLSAEIALRFEELLGDPEKLEHTERMFQETLAELHDRGFEERRAALLMELTAATSVEEEQRLSAEMDRLRKSRRGRWNVVSVSRREGPVGVDKDEHGIGG